MAAGKTSVGRALAARLGVPFADLDALIVQETGRTIPDIFRLEGEQAFRDREAAALVRALEHQRGVLSLGGGAPMHPRAARGRCKAGPSCCSRSTSPSQPAGSPAASAARCSRATTP